MLGMISSGISEGARSTVANARDTGNVESVAGGDPHMMSSEMTTGWDEKLLRGNPHEVADKRRRVREMFAAIAPSYDLNNRLHSLWQDQRWRRRAVKLANVASSDVVVDVAC